MSGMEHHEGVWGCRWEVTHDVISPVDERRLLEELSDCRSKLLRALDGVDATVSAACQRSDEGGKWGAVARRCDQIRADLALSHMPLVSHQARRFRNRGVSQADLMQEGVCGLLEAIDRFDLGHITRLGTYAAWWIRLAMQRAVAGGAYPIRLTPRHLRQLALERRNVPLELRSDPASAETIAFLQKVTRPAVSLNAASIGDLPLELADPLNLQSTLDEEDRAELRKLLEQLSSRELQVLAMRFGLEETSEMSLSEVGGVLGVSKERVRQIQDGALAKLRTAARRRASSVA